MYTEVNLLKGCKNILSNMGKFQTNMHDLKTFAENSVYRKKLARRMRNKSGQFEPTLTLELEDEESRPADLLSPSY